MYTLTLFELLRDRNCVGKVTKTADWLSHEFELRRLVLVDAESGDGVGTSIDREQILRNQPMSPRDGIRMLTFLYNLIAPVPDSESGPAGMFKPA